MIKKRGSYNGQIRNVKEKKKRFKETVGKIFTSRNFAELGVNKVANKSGISKSLLYRYFGNFNNLVEQFLLEHDYWSNVDQELSPKSEKQREEVKDIFNGLFDYLVNKPEGSGLVAWELVEQNRPIFNMLKRRESVGDSFFSRTDDNFGKEIDFRAISAILIGGIYYLSAYGFQQEVPFFGLEVDKEGNRIMDAIDFLLDKVYESS